MIKNKQLIAYMKYHYKMINEHKERGILPARLLLYRWNEYNNNPESDLERKLFHDALYHWTKYLRLLNQEP